MVSPGRTGKPRELWSTSDRARPLLFLFVLGDQLSHGWDKLVRNFHDGVTRIGKSRFVFSDGFLLALLVVMGQHSPDSFSIPTRRELVFFLHVSFTAAQPPGPIRGRSPSTALRAGIPRLRSGREQRPYRCKILTARACLSQRPRRRQQLVR